MTGALGDWETGDMASERRSGWDLLAAVAAAIALAMVVIYEALLRQQQQHAPVVRHADVELLVVGGLVVAAFLSAYGVVRAAPQRAWALAASALVMAVLGVLALLTIGIPILVGAAFALVAAGRAIGRT